MAWAAVTGASGGIGRATALALAADGWDVVVHGRLPSKRLDEVAQRVRDAGRQALPIQADLCDPNQTLHFVDQCWQRTDGMEAWVHLAGADLLTGVQAQWSFDAKLELATRIDLWGTINACRKVGSLMCERGTGSIVTIGWDQAASGMEGDSGQIFAAVKGGVAAFTRSLAKSLAPKVRVNCVAPGWIKTAWGEGASSVWQERVRKETPLGRWGLPDDVAATIAFVVGRQGAFLTGQTINVNGGVVCT